MIRNFIMTAGRSTSKFLSSGRPWQVYPLHTSQVHNIAKHGAKRCCLYEWDLQLQFLTLRDSKFSVRFYSSEPINNKLVETSYHKQIVDENQNPVENDAIVLDPANVMAPRLMYETTVCQGTLTQSGFTVDDEGFTIVYTDGACSNNGREGAKAGVGVWWGHTISHHNRSQPVEGARHTNNTAEIQAAVLAIVQARELKIVKLNIHTDSLFLINSITVWINNWKTNNWRTKAKKPVKNKEDFEVLDGELEQGDVEVKWTHVPGHKGNVGNKAADKLAGLAAKAVVLTTSQELDPE